MIDSLDFQLRDWVRSQAAGVEVVFGLPPVDVGGVSTAVYLYLLDVTPGLTRALRPGEGAESELVLRYLLTVAGETAEAHRLLGELAFAALDATDFTLDAEPLTPDLWQALGLPPQPCLVLRVPLRRRRPQPEVPLVREPLVVDRANLTSLRGRVLGPEDTPLVNALVELPGLRQRQTTDARGHFTFDTIPLADQQTILVRAKGRETSVTVSPTSTGQPVIIRIDPLEEEG